MAKIKFPKWRFENKALSEFGIEYFDYSMCIDVLIHQPSLKASQQLVDDLLKVARKGVVFSAHSQTVNSGISFDTSSIKEFLLAKPEINRVVEILTYRDATLYFAEKKFGDRRTASDIGIPELAVGLDTVEDKQGLLDLIDFSREKIGFFPYSVIRTHEYMWFVDQLSRVNGKEVVLDVGAGVSCIPFKLAERGALVTTVDLHPTIRNEQSRENWNEWGYLDYSQIDSRIKSFNVDMAKVKLGEMFDIVYSISVIEHMPALMRRSVIKAMADHCKPGGRILLSLELIPETEELWNLSEDRQVDNQDHGTIQDVKLELQQAGFKIEFEDILRGMRYSRTDVLYLTGHRAKL